MSKVIEALKKDPRNDPQAIAVLETRDAGADRIRAQQFRPDKEAAELARLDAAADEQLAAYETRAIGDLDAQAQKELRALDVEQAQQRNPFPKRESIDTESLYHTKQFKAVIEGQLKLHDAIRTAADLQVLAYLNDPVSINAIVDEALATRSDESITRIGLLAETRLGAMAKTENDLNGPASQAYLAVTSKIGAWRQTRRTSSFEARRDAIRAKQAIRTNEIRESVKTLRSAYQFGGRPVGSDAGIPTADAYQFGNA